MRKKVDINNIKNKTITFIMNNKLFLIYVLLSVFLGLLLRLITIRGHFYFRAVVADLLMTLLIGSFSFLIKEKNRFSYYC